MLHFLMIHCTFLHYKNNPSWVIWVVLSSSHGPSVQVEISNKLPHASGLFSCLVSKLRTSPSLPQRTLCSSPFSILNFVKSILIDLTPSHVVTTVSDYSIDQNSSQSRERLCNLPTGGHIGELHLLETGVDSTISCRQTFGGLGLNISLGDTFIEKRSN